MPSTKSLFNWLSILALVVFSVVASLLAWKFHYWIADTPVFTYMTDYNLEADEALNRAAAGDIFSLYSGDTAPLMMPLALLVRIPALLIAHGFDFTTVSHYPTITPDNIADYVLRYKIGTISILVFGAVVIGMSMWEKNKKSVIISLVAIVAALFGPLTDDALKWGHPEEFLGAALVFAGILVLVRKWEKRYVISAVLFGLSFAVKQPFWLLAPALLFVFPKEFRIKGTLIAAGVFAVVSLPFIGPHLLDMFTQQTTQVGASTANTSHDLKQNLWIVFGLEDFSAFSRPLILAISLLLPLVAAWRSNWQLSVLQFAAVSASILVLRSILDYFNIDYYLLPGLLALMALEYVAWNEGKHPLKRIALLRYMHFPGLSLGFGVLMSGLTVGWAMKVLTNQNIGDFSPYLYVIVGLITAVFCMTIAFDVKSELTRERKVLYGFVAVALAAFFVVTSFNNGSAGAERRVEAPVGYKEATVDVIQKESANSGGVYWLGAQRVDDKYLRLIAYRPSFYNKGFYSVVDYGDKSDINSITVFTASKKSAFSKNTKNNITTCTPQCKTDVAKNMGGVSRINTPKGPALVKKSTATRTRSSSQLEIHMIINGQAVFITAWNAGLSAEKIISKLRIIRPEDARLAQQAINSLAPAEKPEDVSVS